MDITLKAMNNFSGEDKKYLTDEGSQRLKFWTADSLTIMGFFLLVVFLVVYFWWPLAASVLRRIDWNGNWWLQIDWLLIGIFSFMSVIIIGRANIKTDALLIFVGLCGGLVIEAWGTQTNLWFYYTAERPPLWIIPAWAISNLAIDRISRAINFFITKSIKKNEKENLFKFIYWFLFITFMGFMVPFVIPTIDKSLSIMSLFLCTLIILTPINYRIAVLIFIAGTGLGYFLELWGTTRKCWTYYTHQMPPFFAVIAHGMAAVAFWRAGLIIKKIVKIISNVFFHY